MSRIVFFSSAHCPTSALAEPEAIGDVLALPVGVAARQLEHGRAWSRLHDEERAVVRRDQRRQLRHDEADTVSRFFCPCIMLENLARLVFSQSCSVFFCVVSFRLTIIWLMLSLSERDLALGLDVDRPREIALGHGGRDVGDGAHLRGQVAGELVDVVGELPPGADRARHLGLTAELALDADLARHRARPDRRRCPACRSCC